MEIYVKISFISILYVFFLVFNHDNVIYIDFTRIAASNTATDEVTYQVTHRVFNTNSYHSCAHFILIIDEQCSRTAVFNTI